MSMQFHDVASTSIRHFFNGLNEIFLLKLHGVSFMEHLARKKRHTNISCYFDCSLYNFAFQYKLETFTESRSTKKKKKPYKGGHVDGPENGPAPLPWQIKCEPKKLFKDDKIKKEVPHTAKVKVTLNLLLLLFSYIILLCTCVG